MSAGLGVNSVPGGMMPNSIWRAWIRARSSSSRRRSVPESFGPLRPHVVRAVGGTGGSTEEGFVGTGGLLKRIHSIARSAGPRWVVSGSRGGRRGFRSGWSGREGRLELPRSPAQESVEPLEPGPVGQRSNGPGGTGLPHRRQMRLAEHAGAVTVRARYLGDRGGALRDDTVMPGNHRRFR